jgi:hypothetical protein
MPFHLQVNAHGNHNVDSQNNNEWENWPQDGHHGNADLDLNQAPYAEIMDEDHPILQQQVDHEHNCQFL